MEAAFITQHTSLLTGAKRVLIVKLSAIGDVLHALPVAAALKDAYPHLTIDWAVEEPFVPLLAGNPCLANVIGLPKLRGSRLRSASFRRDYLRRLQALRENRYDVSLDLQGLTKSAIVAVASGAKIRLGYHWLREAAKFLEKPVPRRPESVHIVDQYLDVARFLGASPAVVRFPFDIPAEDAIAVETLLAEAGLAPGSKFVTLNPASARPEKEWAAEKFAALADAIFTQSGTPTALVTADVAAARRVVDAAKEPVINLAGRTNLKQLADVLRRGTAHVCGDTGSGHLAAALNVPVVSLFGPTDPLRSCPYGQSALVVSHREVCDPNCRGNKCALPHPRCMDAITVAEVFQILELGLHGLK